MARPHLPPCLAVSDLMLTLVMGEVERMANDPRRAWGIRQSGSFSLSSSASLPAAMFGVGEAQSAY
jgi:hypothetical protein